MLCYMADNFCMKKYKAIIPLSMKVAAPWDFFPKCQYVSYAGSDQLALP
jgi:hypothetical protein